MSDVFVSDSAENILNGHDSKLIQCTGLWDTGAERTGISNSLVKKLALQSTSKIFVNGVNGLFQTDTCIVDLWLSKNFVIRRVDVFKASLIKGIDVLIGMDIITRGNFSISNINGKTLFNFSEPETFA